MKDGQVKGDRLEALHKIRDEIEGKHLADMRTGSNYISFNLDGSEVCLDGCFSIEELQRLMMATKELQKKAEAI